MEFNQIVMSSDFKGAPISSHGITIGEFLAEAPNLFTSEFQFPLAVLRKSSLEHNLRRMAQYCSEKGVKISPHVKTHMSPQIAQMQIDHGAWALTVANFSQASVFLDFGFKRILIANEVVDFSAIREISRLNQVEGIEIYFYVDSLVGFELAKEALAADGSGSIHLFLEVGMVGARAGIRNLDEIEPLVRAISQDSRFDIAGVSGFEGVVPVPDRSITGLMEVRSFCQRIVSAAKVLRRLQPDSNIILTAGGSNYFDVVVEEFSKFETNTRIVIRSGGYVAHDNGIYERTYPFAGELPAKQFVPAIEVWAQVLSQPQDNWAILNLGKRDVGNDLENPFPLKKVLRGKSKIQPYSGMIDRLNDQHGYLLFDQSNQVEIGDLIGMGISHPCTTFDKWRHIPLVDDGYQVVDLIHTYF